MSSFQWKRSLIGALIINAVIGPNLLVAQSSAPTDQPGRVSIAYVPPENSTLQEQLNQLASLVVRVAQDLISS